MKPQIHIIEASAGSGKTYYLAKKYLSLVLNSSLDIPFSNILAITFTNRAAYEMKERVLEFLKKIALDSLGNEREEEFLFGLDQKEVVQKRAHQVIGEIIRNYNFFQIQTIDSFVNAILYGCAYRMGLSLNFKTEKYWHQYLSYGLDRLIEKANSEKEVLRLFRHFIHQYLYIENKTGWFPKQDILKSISSFFSDYNKYAGKFAPNETEAKDLIIKKKNLLKEIRILYNKLPPQTHKKFVSSLKSFLDTHSESFDLSEISAYFRKEIFPMVKGLAVPVQIINLWEKIRDDLREICEMESLSLFNSYINVFNEVLEEISHYIRRENILFLEALNKEAYALFKEADLGLPELYYRLSLRLKYFFIDEFQDTSKLQWNNLFEMIKDALARGGTFFYVGDKKQAIYRFRGGEVSLFEEVKAYFRGFEAEKETLKKNYRSRKEIVEFNNLVFSEPNLRRFLSEKEQVENNDIGFTEREIERIIEIFGESKQEYLREDGYVRLELFSCEDKEERDEVLKERIVSLIRDLQKRYFLNDIALLARKNSEVELLSGWLLEKLIPVESEKTLNVRDNSCIKEIVSFLKFLSHPVDNLPFASFILGKIFCLKAGIEKSEIENFIFKVHLKKNSSYLYREFRKTFPFFWERLIEEFFKSVGFVPLYELLVTLFEKFSVFSNFPEHQGFFMKFLEIVKENEEKYPDILSFLEFFENISPEELYVDVTKADAVKILTIHKAKGLGFRVVVIPFLEMVLESPKQFIVSEGDKLRLLYLRKIYNDYSSRLADLYKKESFNSFIDELNSLYVAFTRAEDELYIFSSNIGRRKNLAYLLLPPGKVEYGKPETYRKDKGDISSTVEISGSKYKDWIGVLKDEFIEKSVIEDRDKIVYGEVMHMVLSSIGNLYLKNTPSVLTEAIEKARLHFPYFDKYEKVKEAASFLLEKKEFREFFEIEEGRVFQEQELVDSTGNTHRVDRLIVKDKDVWVIDFKTGRKREIENYNQVKGYITILREIYPAKNIIGFLIYLDDFSLVKIYE